MSNTTSSIKCFRRTTVDLFFLRQRNYHSNKSRYNGPTINRIYGNYEVANIYFSYYTIVGILRYTTLYFIGKTRKNTTIKIITVGLHLQYRYKMFLSFNNIGIMHSSIQPNIVTLINERDSCNIINNNVILLFVRNPTGLYINHGPYLS